MRGSRWLNVAVYPADLDEREHKADEIDAHADSHDRSPG
jgi:hypothetical protein